MELLPYCLLTFIIQWCLLFNPRQLHYFLLSYHRYHAMNCIHSFFIFIVRFRHRSLLQVSIGTPSSLEFAFSYPVLNVVLVVFNGNNVFCHHVKKLTLSVGDANIYEPERRSPKARKKGHYDEENKHFFPKVAHPRRKVTCIYVMPVTEPSSE